MPETTIPEITATQTRDWFSRELFTVCAALAVSLAAAELVEVNRFLRTVVQGRAFWCYLLVLLTILGLLLAVSLRRSTESQSENLAKLLLTGIVLGFLGSVIAVSATPLLADGSLSPTINAWKHPLYLASAALLGFGWFYGALAELTVYFIHRGRYLRIGMLLLACAAIRLIEMLPLARLTQH